jgi:hypothetical protein
MSGSERAGDAIDLIVATINALVGIVGKSAVEQGGRCVDHQPKPIFGSQYILAGLAALRTGGFFGRVLPLLRRQNGFKDEITFSGPGGIDVTAISLWDNKASADTYNTSTYPEVLKTMARSMEGTPRFRTARLSIRPSTRSLLE